MVLSYATLVLIYIVHSLAHDETFIKNIDPVNNQPKPVPFGHIFKDGIDDLTSDFKVPYDLLELDMRFPKTKEEEDRLLKELPKQRMIKLVHPDEKLCINPRDAYLDDLLLLGNKEVTQKPIDDDQPRWFNFAKIQEQNVASPRAKVAMSTERIDHNRNLFNVLPYVENANKKFSYFSRTSFDLLPDPGGDRLNWTTCKEFGKGLGPKHMFHPNDIVDMDWEPFYVWAYRTNVAFNIHRFSFPTKKIVKEYKDLYGRYLNKSLDWERPKLLLREQMEMLLIAADRNGLFSGIPKQPLPLSFKNKNISLPIINLRLKIEDPYLAMMYCDDFYATIMATPGNSPENDQEKKEEASILKFRGEGYPISRDLFMESFMKRTGKQKNYGGEYEAMEKPNWNI